ncbi:phospholipase A [Sphingobacterium multivorum]|uniref:phospholipase A n=1 Tax=Sphingobacterium multivorum TaxID=28454 RepID=UPI00289C9434|nr:phospholipase A [Sphingobacterium multivorum]
MNTVRQYIYKGGLDKLKAKGYCFTRNNGKGLYSDEKGNTKFIMLGLLLFPFFSYAQYGMSRDSTEYAISHSPAFSIFKDNYFISGIPLNHEPSKDNSDAKFQFSFKQRIQNRPLVWGAYFYLTYTQKSFWDIYKKSSPFAETNYNPALQLAKPIYRAGRFVGVFGLSIEHESNGRDSIYSRSWNFIGLTYSHFFSETVNASLKINIPIERSDNPDLNKYIGYTEAQLAWNIKKDKLILDVMGRKGASWDTKGSLMTTLSFRPSEKRNLYWTLQWWQGYGESLVDYNRSVSMIRIGFMVKPTFFRFY